MPGRQPDKSSAPNLGGFKLDLRAIFEQLKTLWTKMDATRRWITVVAILLVAGLIFLITQIATTPKYELLYSKLTEEDKAQIIVKLNEMKVPYRESASGGIEVPNSTTVRANLLTQGIPSGGSVGWEIFDQTSFSDTDFTNQIKKQRAIIGEIERTMRKISGIDDAKVILNMADDSEYIFADDKPEGSASILLTLHEPGILSENQVESILNLVKNATGLKEDNITIVDNFANDLTAALRPRQTGSLGGKSGSNGTSLADRFAYTAQYEEETRRNVERLLAKPFGFKKVVAVVKAELDLDYQETKSQTFADKGVPRSEQEKNETYEGTSANSVGVPGTDSNITQYKAPDAGNVVMKGEKSEHTVNNEISNVEQFTVNAPGKVKRQSVSVYVDGNLTPEIKQSVYNLAKEAAGVVEERGDKLSVETFSLAPAAQPARQTIPWTNWSIAAVLGALLLTLIILVIVKEPAPQRVETVKTITQQVQRPERVVIKEREKVIRQKQAATAKAPTAAEIALGPLPRGQEEGEEEVPVPIVGTKIDKLIEDRAQQEQAAGGGVFEEAALPPKPEPTPEEKLRNEHLEAIQKMATDKPADLAALLRAWLSED